MNDFFDYLYPLVVCVYGLLLAAWRAVPVFLVALLIDSVFIRRLPARVHCGLWILVLGRLLLPFSITSPISPSSVTDQAWSKFDQWLYSAPKSSTPEFEVATWKVRSGEYVSEPILPPGSSKELQARAKAYAASVHDRKVAELDNPAPRLTANTFHHRFDWEDALVLIILITWPCVAMGLGLRHWSAYRRFSQSVKRSPTLELPEYTQILAAICREYGIAHIPTIRLVESLAAPAMFGIWRPTLCMPSSALSDLSPRELNWVMRHELAHVRRKDALVLLLATIVQTLHWFHPIAWVAVHRLKLRIEQAADERATKQLRGVDIIVYGQLLMRYATSMRMQESLNAVGAMSMASHRNLRSRLERLGNFSDKLTLQAKIALASLLLVVGLFGLTDAEVHNQVRPTNHHRNNNRLALTASFVQKGNDPILDAIRQHERSLSQTDPEKEEVTREVSFDLNDAIERALRIEPNIDIERFFKTFVWNDKSATLEGGVLRARLTESQSRLAQGFLDSFLQYGQGQIVQDVRFIEADVAFGYDWEWSLVSLDTITSTELNATVGPSSATVALNPPEPPGYLQPSHTHDRQRIKPSLVAIISDTELGVLLHRIQSGRSQGSDIVMAPKVTHFFGQQVSISDASQHPFVTNVHVVRGTETSACQPWIDTIDQGTLIHLFAAPASDDEIEVSCAILESKIESVEHALLPINPRRNGAEDKDLVEIQVPKVHRNALGAKVRLAKDENLVICSPQGYDPGKNLPNTKAKFYVITPTIIVDEATELKQFVKVDTSLLGPN